MRHRVLITFAYRIDYLRMDKTFMNSARTVIKFQVYRANISFKAILLLQFDISMHDYVKFDYSETLFIEYYSWIY